MPRPDQADLVRTHQPVHDVVAGVTRRLPARTAVRSGPDAVTYRELDQWAGQIARRLVAAGVGAGDHVGVLVEPSPALVAAALGTLRAGAAYVLPGPSAPDGGPGTPSRDPGAALPGAVCCVVARGTGPAGQAPPGQGHLPTVPVERGVTPSEPAREHAAFPASAPDGPACVTWPASGGDTDTYRGAVRTHAELSAATAVRRALCPGAPVLLLTEPLAHDSAAAGLWATLTAGGRLVVADAEDARDPEAVAGLVEKHRVTQLLCPPVLFGDILAASRGSRLQRLRTLDTVTLTGGPLPPSLMDRHESLLGRSVTLIDLDRCAIPVTAGPHRYGGPAPLGRAEADARGRFGRPDAVVRRLPRPPAHPRTGAEAAR